MPSPSRRRSILLAALVVVAVLFAAAHLPPVQSAVATRVVRALGDAGLVARVDRLDYNLLTRRVAARGVRLAAAETPDTPFLEAAAVEVVLSWRVLLGGLALSSVDVRETTLTVVVDEEGRDNLPAGGDGEGGLTRLDVGRASVRGFAVHYDHRPDAVHVRAADLALDLHPAPDGTRGTVSTGGPVVLEFGTLALHVHDVAGYVEFDGASVSLDELRFEVTGGDTHPAPHARSDRRPTPPSLTEGRSGRSPAMASVRVDGRITDVFASPEADVTVGGTLRAGPLARWLDVDPAPSGPIDWHGTISGPLTSPLVGLTATSTEIAYETLARIDLDIGVEVSTEALRVDRLRVGLAGGEITAAGSVGLGETTGGAFSARWQDLRVNDVASALGIDAGIGAVLAGQVEATWHRGLPSVDLTLTHEARGAGAPSMVPLSGRASLTARAGAWTLDHAHRAGEAAVVSGRASGRLAESFADTTLGGSLQVDVPGIPALLDLARSAGVSLPAGLEDRLDGRIALDGSLAGTVSAPRVSARLEVEDLRLEAARGGRLSATVLADPATLAFTDLDATLDDVSARGEVTLGLEGETLAGRLVAMAADIDAVNRLAGRTDGPWPLAGRARIDVGLGGTWARPTVDATATLDGIRAFGQHLDGGEVSVRLDGGRVFLDRLDLRQDGGALTAAGTIDLRGNEVEIRVEGRRLAIAPVVVAPDTEAIGVEALIDELRLDARGPLAHLAGGGRVDLSGVGLDEYSIGRMGVDVELDAGTARLDVALYDLDVTADGQVALASPWDFALNARVDTDDLRKPLPPRLRDTDRVLGRLHVESTAAGTLAAPADVEITARLLTLEARIGTTPLVLERADEMRWADREGEIPGLAVRLGRTRLVAAGRFGRPGDRLSLTVAGPADDLASLLSLAGLDDEVALAGTLDVRVGLLDTLERPGLDAAVHVENGSVRLGSLPPFIVGRLDASLDAGVIHLTGAEAAWQGARASATGRVPMRLVAPWLPAAYVDGLPAAGESARIDARVDDLTERALAPFVDAETAAALEGVLAATAWFEADEIRVSAVRGRVEFERAAVEIAQVPLAQVSPTRLVLDDGRLRVEEWVWAGAGNRLEVVGGLSFTDEGEVRVDAAADALIDLRLIGAFVEGVATAGRVDVSLAAGGPVGAPEIDGRIIVSGGEARLREPRLAVSGVSGSLVLRGDELRIDRMTGTANGGPIEVGGRARFPAFAIGELDVSLTGRGIAMDIEGLQSEVNVAVTLSQPPTAVVPRLFGEVTVVRGGYRRPLSLAQLLRGQGAPAAPQAAPAAGTGLMATRLDVAVITREDLAFDNNYGRFEMGADLRAIGTLAEPSLAGRAELREGGQVFLGGNRYQIERGTVDFTNPARIEPEIDLTARTRVRGHEITLNVSGTPETITADLTSDDPSLAQGDLVSLLLTGRTRDETGGAEAEVARDQLLGLLSGELLGAAGRAVGLDAVRIERSDGADTFDVGPWALSDETDPSSRITLSKNLGQQFELALSQSLRDSNSLTWIATYRPGRNVDLRVISRDNTSMAYEARQDVSFGGTAGGQTLRRSRPPAPRVSSVVIEGVDETVRAALERRLRVDRGSRFDFFRWQDDRERVLAYFHELGFFEASVDATRDDTEPGPDGGSVALAYVVDPGPRTTLEIEGVELPARVEREMVDAWTRTVYDGFLLDDLRGIVEGALLADGYLDADVRAEVRPGTPPGDKHVVVRVTAGRRTTDRRIEFTGHGVLSARRLEQIIEEAGIADEVWREPALAERPIRAAYERQGRLGASVETSPPAIEGDRGRLLVAIDEGPPFVVGNVSVAGASGIAEDAVREAFRLQPGDAYDPDRVDSARRRVEQLYRRHGYNAARLVVRQEVERDAATVAVDLAIDEGPQQVLGEIVVEGADRTRAGVIERALSLERGAPVDLSEWYQARRRLYQTGVFRRADVEPVPVEADGPDAGAERTEVVPEAAQSAAPGPRVEEVQARVSLVEWPLYRFRYGFQVTDDRSPESERRRVRPGVVFDLQRRNLIGIADSAGAAVRIENRRWLVRGFASAPRFFALPLTTNLFVTRSRETFGGGETLRFVTTRWDVAAEQRYRRGRAVSLNYGYRYEWNRTFDPARDPDDPFGLDITINIARLTSGIAIDTRDDPFDATRGWFHTSNVEYSSERLGSDLRFVKYLLQHYDYRPVGRGIVLASAARVGLSQGFGQEIVPSERFFAGGGNSVRGYAEDSLGERSFLGDPRGGEALLVLNQEVRFPIRGFVRGVAFADAGNVFANPARIALGELEVGVGAGLRLDTPFALLRIDYGVPVSRPRGERGARWFFSIGQAF